MSSTVFEKSLNLLVESKFRNMKIVHFTGGEPLLKWSNLQRFIECVNILKRPNIKIVLGTNGSLLTADKVRFLRENNVYLIVSLDGRRDVNVLRINYTGGETFKKTVRGIELLKKFEVPIGISMVVSSVNVDVLKDQIFWLVKRFEPMSIGTNFLRPASNGFTFAVEPEKFVRAIYDSWKEVRWLDKPPLMEYVARKLIPFINGIQCLSDCGAMTGTTINVAPTGVIGPCKTLVLSGMITGSDLKILSVLKCRSPLSISACRSCEAISICGNGCAFNAQRLCGSAYKVDLEGCRISRSFYQEFIKDVENFGGDKNKMIGNLGLDPKNPLHHSIGHFFDI